MTTHLPISNSVSLKFPYKNAVCFAIQATRPAHGSRLDFTVLTVPDDLQFIEHEVPRHAPGSSLSKLPLL